MKTTFKKFITNPYLSLLVLGKDIIEVVRYAKGELIQTVNGSLIIKIPMTDFVINIIFDIIIVIILFSVLKKLRAQEGTKDKLMSLKKFRDKEMVRVLNHFNTQFLTIENRLASINEKGKFYTITKPSVNEENILKENHKTILKEVEDYNKAFDFWGMEKYGTGDTKPNYDKMNFDINTPKK